MATNTQRNRKQQTLLPEQSRKILARYFPLWALLSVIFILTLPELMTFTINGTIRIITVAPGMIINATIDAVEGAFNVGSDAVSGVGDEVAWLFHGASSGELAPLFTAQVDHWSDDISRWATTYDLDPNLLATVMQIESCGHPTVSSPAGAQGLFQVMPFHFASDEIQLDPDTNAMRGAGVLNYCLETANGDVGLAMACYNGGPSLVNQPFSAWSSEPQRYYTWGTGIYADAQQNKSTSDTLTSWLNAGGVNLCNLASSALGIN